MQTHFSYKLAQGKVGESAIARYLVSRGFNVLPVYEKEVNDGKGPVLIQRDRSTIAPDMLIFSDDGKIVWVEAKHKSAFTFYRKTSEWMTGIDIRHYEEYLRVSATTPFPVWLLFLHREGCAKDTPLGKISPTGLFGNDIKELAKKEHHRSMNHGRSGMVYWAPEALFKLADLEDILPLSSSYRQPISVVSPTTKGVLNGH